VSVIKPAYLLDVLASVVGSEGAAYVCGPLSTGRAYYELISQDKLREADSIRLVNEQAMRRFAESLRRRLRCPVIDPALLRIPEWSSKEIGDFFIQVIDRFVCELRCMDGWEFSRGATKEFQFAMVRKVRCLDERGNALGAREGIALITAAQRHVSSLGLDSSRLQARVEALRAI
jgi:hypothetical protein